MFFILFLSFAQVQPTSFFVTGEIKVGDILTSLSIIISVSLLLRAWAKDRSDRNKELADKIRSAAAKTLAKLDRWQELSLWLFQYTQPLFIETSEMLIKDFDIVAARDHFWKKANENRLIILGRVLDEEIEMAYVELYGYHPTVHALFVKTMQELKALEMDVFSGFIESSQEAIRSYIDKQKTYRSAQLGNELRNRAFHYDEILKEKTDIVLNPIREFLVEIISMSDVDLVKERADARLKRIRI